MHKRRCLVISIISSCLAIPVIIGSSCPAPSNPMYLHVGTNPPGARLLPSCKDPQSICISIVNEACVNVDIALYIHDGYDPTGRYLWLHEDDDDSTVIVNGEEQEEECHDWVNGELRLPRPELFQGNNLWQITAGSTVYTLEPGASKVVQVQCEDVKSMGLAVAQSGGANVLTAPEYSQGPEYRCRERCLPEDLPEDCVDIVPCGETIEFLVQDYNECVHPAATDLYVKEIDEAQVSAVCTWYDEPVCQQRR